MADPSDVARALIVIACLSPAAMLGQAPAHQSEVVQWARGVTEDNWGDEVPAFALETEAGDVPALAALLVRGAEPQRAAAGLALIYGSSGDAGIEALRAAGPAMTGLLILGLANRGSPQDRAELIAALERDDAGDEEPPSAQAALALAVLRATAAIPALERRAAGQDDTADAAREALLWIRQGPWQVDGLPSASDEHQIIAAALRVGIPWTDDATVFDDDDRGGVWMRDSAAWRFRPGARAAGAASLGFTVDVNAQRTRARLAVSVSFGPKHGAGYDYLLTREADGWKLRGVIPTWIA